MPERAETTELFTASRAAFAELLDFAGGQAATTLDHAALEEQLTARGRELLRQLYQDHLDLRGQRERRLAAVTDAQGVSRRIVERDHERTLATVFGDVTVRRLAYRAPGQANLHPADAALNLPGEKHSHGLRRLAATEAARGSFDDARAALTRVTAVATGKRQIEALTVRAAADFTAFYAARRAPAATGYSCCRSTARASSCVPTRCVRRPRRPPDRPAGSWPAGCRRARSAAASASPRSARCTTRPR